MQSLPPNGPSPKAMAPPVVSIVSKKNSGKTTLLEKLIAELRRRGRRVGTVKHDVHGFDIDHEGKDTWRHKQAGAMAVVISSPRKLAMVREVSEEAELDDLIARYLADMDIVITEGYKRADKPQIEVFRQAAHTTPLDADQRGTLVAVASDIPVDLGVPRFHVNDVAALADFIEARFLSPTPIRNAASPSDGTA